MAWLPGPHHGGNGFAKFPSRALPYAASLTGRMLMVWLSYVEAGHNWDRPVTARKVAHATGLSIDHVRRCASKLLKHDWMRPRAGPARHHPSGASYTFAFLDFEPAFAGAQTKKPVAAAPIQAAAAEKQHPEVVRGAEPTAFFVRGAEPTASLSWGQEPTAGSSRALVTPDQINLPLPPSKDLVGRRTPGATSPEHGRREGAVESRVGSEAAIRAAPAVRAQLSERDLGVYSERHVAARLARTASALHDAGITPPTAEEWKAYFARALREPSIVDDPRVRNVFHVAAWPERVKTWLQRRRRAPRRATAPPPEPKTTVDAAEMRAFVEQFQGGPPKKANAAPKPKRDALSLYERDAHLAALERAETGSHEQPEWFLERWPKPPADAPPGRLEHEQRKREELDGPGLASIRQLANEEEKAG